MKLFDGTIVSAVVVKQNPKTLWVRLPYGKPYNGKIIKRHKAKHIPAA